MPVYDRQGVVHLRQPETQVTGVLEIAIEENADDRIANDQALVDGSGILCAYRTSLGETLWIVTEAGDETGDELQQEFDVVGFLAPVRRGP